MTTGALTVPVVTADTGTLEAALAYAEAGWYVGPLRRGTKHPGSRLGQHWQQKTSRNPEVITAWFAGSDDGVFLHVGRSGAVALDVDDATKLPPAIRQAVEQHRPPFQSTRPDCPGRGHYVFAQPPGRDLGNSLGGVAGGWGEVRGRNGVIIVAPSVHAGEGRYLWQRTGPAPVLPGYLASQLPDAPEAAETATDAQVTAFIAEHRASARPELISVHVQAWRAQVALGESRHATMCGHLAGAMKEAAAGLVNASDAVEALRHFFLEAVASPGCSTKQGPPRVGAVAFSEWAGLLSWAVAQALAADPAMTLARVAEKAPAQVQEVSSTDICPEGPAGAEAEETPTRRLILTSAADIRPRRVKWLWDGRLALGTLGLLAGREGVGKSTSAYWAAAQITRGLLPGEYLGQPKTVLICATEDSWEHTIVPRLIAAGADLTKVYRVEVIKADNIHDGLSLPKDLHDVRTQARELGAAMLLLDPLTSRLDSALDTHKDSDVRRALEPMVAMADITGMAVLGIIHHNKSASTDPLQLVMGSKAFSAVARSVHTVIPDPDDDTDSRRLFGTPKNNLGRDDLPTLTFTVASHAVETDDGTAWTGKLVWGEENPASISESMRRAADQGEDRSATSEVTDWLSDYLSSNGGRAASADIRAAGGRCGHSYDSLKRARKRLRLKIESLGYPRRTDWVDPSRSSGSVQSEQQSEQPSRGDSLTTLTAPTGGQKPQSAHWEQSGETGDLAIPTANGHDPLAQIRVGRCPTCRQHVLTQGHRFHCPERASA